MAENIYSVQKIMYHPDKLADIKAGKQVAPVQLQLMPNNSCNHNCSWCYYRVPNNPKVLFDWKSYIPWDILQQTLRDFKEMGGKCVELTGGGEPSIYPHFKEMFREMINLDLQYSLITNGVRITDEIGQLIGPKMTWTRVSLDAGTKETYRKVHRGGKDDFDKAVKSIEYLRKYSQNPEFRLGVGYVVCNDNYTEMYEACKIAREAGAHNFKVSAAFLPEGKSYWEEETLKVGAEVSKKCLELATDDFQVYNIFDERIDNVMLGEQDYRYCGTKELLVVITGECGVYTCCTLSYTPNGLIGNLKDMSFKELWNSPKKIEMYDNFDAREKCKCPCLYEQRNRFINKVLFDKPLHVNYI